MKKVICACKPFSSQIRQDYMLAACLLGPIFMGIVFRFVLPVVEELLCEKLGVITILSSYYIIFDLLLAIMTPIMFCFAGVMVVLEEFDYGIVRYYAVTPLGKSGYLVSRIAIPAMLSVFYDVILLVIFSVSDMDFMMKIVFSISGGGMGILTSLLVISFAKNKMEGMVLVKLCGLLVVGVPIAYFVPEPIQYVVSFLPSFWMGKFSMTKNYLLVIPVMLWNFLLLVCFYDKFRKKFV